MIADTPPCNTGVHPPADNGQETPSRSHFDWYRATVPASVEALTEAVLAEAGPYARIVEGKGRFNYLKSRTIEQGGDRAATILFGGPNGHPNIEASGDRAPRLAKLLRAGGTHRVTRCDVAVDLWGEGLYPRLSALADRIAGDQGIGWREITDRNPMKGNTTYLGSRKSSVFARIYEKGKADRDRYGSMPAEVLNGWVRVELEVKPEKDMKAVAAGLEPDQFWGVSAWTQQLAQEALQMAPDPIPFHPRRTATDERAFRFMVAQYRNLMHRRCQTVHQGDRQALAQEWLDALFEGEDSAAA